MNEKFFICGHCGTPTNEAGGPLSADELPGWQQNNATMVNGDCCAHLAYPQRERVIVTRDMAIDAGDLSMEGMEIEW